MVSNSIALFYRSEDRELTDEERARGRELLRDRLPASIRWGIFCFVGVLGWFIILGGLAGTGREWVIAATSPILLVVLIGLAVAESRRRAARLVSTSESVRRYSLHAPPLAWEPVDEGSRELLEGLFEDAYSELHILGVIEWFEPDEARPDLPAEFEVLGGSLYSLAGVVCK